MTAISAIGNIVPNPLSDLSAVLTDYGDAPLLDAGVVMTGLGNPIHTIMKLSIPEMPGQLPLAIQLHLLVHESMHKVGAFIAGLQSGAIDMSRTYFGYVGEIFHSIAPQIYKFCSESEEISTIIHTHSESGNLLQNTIRTGLPLVALPIVGYALLEYGIQHKDRLFGKLAACIGMSFALEPVISMIGNLNYMATDAYKVINNVMSMCNVDSFEMERVPYYLTVIGTTLAMYAIGRKVTNRLFSPSAS